jgi:hypothetical protein
MVASACCWLYLLTARLVATMTLTDRKQRRIAFAAKSRCHNSIGVQRDFHTTLMA